MHNGEPVSPRDQDTIELLGYSSTFNMAYPIVTVTERIKGNYFGFLYGEAHWILAGDDRVEPIARYAPQIVKFSDDGLRFFGAYGPRIAEQLEGVVQKLADDHDTRQAVLTTWRPNPPRTKDCPCTVAVQFLLRTHVDGAGLKQMRIHCIDTMRSSDLWLGWVFDVFNFSMLSLVIALILRNRFGVNCALGSLTLQAGSQHVYRRNVENVLRCLDPGVSVLPYRRFDVTDWTDEAQLQRYLASKAEAGEL